jgi:hypothetical protein
MVPGDLRGTGFEDWTGTHEQWATRATGELDRLDWSPMGDGFWLRLADHAQ